MKLTAMLKGGQGRSAGDVKDSAMILAAIAGAAVLLLMWL